MISTSENHWLEGKLTFGDPFSDSGVGGVRVKELRYKLSNSQFWYNPWNSRFRYKPSDSQP